MFVLVNWVKTLFKQSSVSLNNVRIISKFCVFAVRFSHRPSDIVDKCRTWIGEERSSNIRGVVVMGDLNVNQVSEQVHAISRVIADDVVADEQAFHTFDIHSTSPV